MTAHTSLAIEFAVAEAADLARAGDHRAALRTLDGLDSGHPAVSDLRARIHAQLGEFAEADAAWRRVLVTDSEHAGAVAGTRLIAQITAGKQRPRPFPAGAVVAAGAAVVVVGAVAAVTVYASTDSAPPAAAPPSSSEPSTPAPRSTRAAETSATDQLRGRLDTLAARLAMPGVHVERRERDITVLFDRGLFLPDGAQLSPAGRRDLTQWGNSLAGQAVRVSVYGHGVVVSGGPTSGGSAVAVSRAAAAANALAAASGLPPTSFTAAAADQSAPPFPGADQDSRARNRTVTVVVSPL
ncbi:OmpA family protein [Kibdelosporangium phytohabitans]|uniref:OmpA-like domain-containing protein n=1 Tax=Kibdelosporangium phytohabitans TaxID=860235 RepID=A0A0N9I0M0_9PSEU|nr:OmpA family protein [Kibdelosporangium phytohabitans]ALG09549.1 hypothetical protein AOZ06_23960 [Kibdelosporangium phytohabitans]MBE1469134.1 outer membrane protein OmpA-like peptidoglycan-associated protein [Kibdelosporangium phytohabitans]